MLAVRLLECSFLETSTAAYKRMAEFLQVIMENQTQLATVLAQSKQVQDSSLVIERCHQ